MKAIVEYTKEEAEAMSEKYRDLKEKVKGLTKNDMFYDYTRQTGYAHYLFSGKVKEELVDCLGKMPDGNEIILLVDGYSHFGASCSVETDGSFRGRVYTD